MCCQATPPWTYKWHGPLRPGPCCVCSRVVMPWTIPASSQGIHESEFRMSAREPPTRRPKAAPKSQRHAREDAARQLAQRDPSAHGHRRQVRRKLCAIREGTDHLRRRPARRGQAHGATGRFLCSQVVQWRRAQGARKWRVRRPIRRRRQRGQGAAEVPPPSTEGQGSCASEGAAARRGV